MDSEGPARDPIIHFAEWMEDAVRADIRLPHAMAVATASLDGEPSARMLLLRGFDDRGFVFYTNYESLKGRQLATNPRAALVFHWDALERQVRVSGPVERVTEAESEAYFATRPLGSRIAAWASRQGEPIESRDVLERAVVELETRFNEGSVPLPPHWGGYRVRAELMEFWEARPNRLHERVLYARGADDEWDITRLSP